GVGAGARGTGAAVEGVAPGAADRSAPGVVVAAGSAAAGAGAGVGAGLGADSAIRSTSTTTPSRKTTRSRAKNMIKRLPVTIWLFGSPLRAMTCSRFAPISGDGGSAAPTPTRNASARQNAFNQTMY